MKLLKTLPFNDPDRQMLVYKEQRRFDSNQPNYMPQWTHIMVLQRHVYYKFKGMPYITSLKENHEHLFVETMEYLYIFCVYNKQHSDQIKYADKPAYLRRLVLFCDEFLELYYDASGQFDYARFLKNRTSNISKNEQAWPLFVADFLERTDLNKYSVSTRRSI